MHYLIQATLAELKDATMDIFDGVYWVKDWTDHGGETYVAHYKQGQAVISGPLIGNPALPWFEIQCEGDTAVPILDALGFPYGLMKDELRKPGLRGAYKASIANPRNSRSLIRNSGGQAVGVTAGFSICGTNLAASFLAGEEAEEAEEITGLE